MAQSGELIVITGPTGSGKTVTLEEHLARYHWIYGNVTLIKSEKDTRPTNGNSFSTNRPDLAETKRLSQIPKPIVAKKLKEVDIKNSVVIGIDEGQFFEDIERVLEWVVVQKKIVIVTILSLDWRGKPFNSLKIGGDPHTYATGVGIIIDHADCVERLRGTCKKCVEKAKAEGKPLSARKTRNAMYSARLTESKDLIEIGGADKYAAMCREHFMEHYKFEFYNDD